MPLNKSNRHIFIYGLIAVCAISLTTLFSLFEIRREASRQAVQLQESHLRTFWVMLREKGYPMAVVNGRLLAGDYVVNGDYELPDRIKELFGGVATIFMGDVRVSTNVLLPDGARAVGVRLKGPVREALFVNGRSYRGESTILGTPYFVAYDPIRDARGKVIGALFVGEWVAEKLLSRQEKVLQGGLSPLAALEAIFMAHIDFVVEHPGVPRILFGELQRGESTAPKRMAQSLIRRYAERVQQLLEEGKECGDVDTSLESEAGAILFIGTVQGLVMQSLLAGDVGRIQRVAPQAFAIFRRGIGRTQ